MHVNNWDDYAAHINSRAKAHGQGDKITGEQLKARFEFYGDLCWMCGIESEGIDHVKPLSAGGANVAANIRPCCLRCNALKGSWWRSNLWYEAYPYSTALRTRSTRFIRRNYEERERKGANGRPTGIIPKWLVDEILAYKREHGEEPSGRWIRRITKERTGMGVNRDKQIRALALARQAEEP